MKFGSKALVFMLCLIIIVAALPMDSFTMFKGNDSDKAFILDTDSKVVESAALITGKSLRDYVIESAGLYLDSYSNVLALLKEIEVAELGNPDITKLADLANNAVVNMEKCNAAYVSLHAVSLQTQYNPIVIHELKRFNYVRFMNSNKLNKPIFKSLQDYLQKSDVRGAYYQMLMDTESILTLLYTVKSAVDKGQLPLASSLWEANQAYSESLLFGQYMAAIFADIIQGL